MDTQPIFIVGVQRSGTTLLSAMLAAHSRLSCGAETHFFRKLSPTDAQRISARETWPTAAVDFVTSIRHTGFVSSESKALLEKYQLDAASVEAYLREKEPSVANVLASVTELYMAKRQKQRWVEKTPDHLLHMGMLRKYFPNSPVIRIVRDPRDVALSLMKVPWGVKRFSEGIFYWDRLEKSSRDFFERDRLSLTIRFEDLVSSPTDTLKAVCDFIGESFEAAMLDTSNTGAEINTRNVPWKSKVSQALDASRATAWKKALSPRENQLAEAVVGDRLDAFRYPREVTFSRFAELPADLDVLPKYADALEVLVADSVRFWRANPGESATVHMYLGEPGSVDWAARSTSSAKDVFTVLSDVTRTVMSDHSVYWIPDSEGRAWYGWRPLFLRTCLSPFKVQMNAYDPAQA